MNAVGADDSVALDLLAALDGDGRRLGVDRLDGTRQAEHSWRTLAVGRKGGVPERRVQMSTVDQLWLSQIRVVDVVAEDAPETVAVGVVICVPTQCDTAVSIEVDAQTAQGLGDVDGHVDGGADLTGEVTLLEEGDEVALAAESDGTREAGDAGASDGDAQGLSCYAVC